MFVRDAPLRVAARSRVSGIPARVAVFVITVSHTRPSSELDRGPRSIADVPTITAPGPAAIRNKTYIREIVRQVVLVLSATVLVLVLEKIAMKTVAWSGASLTPGSVGDPRQGKMLRGALWTLRN